MQLCCIGKKNRLHSRQERLQNHTQDPYDDTVLMRLFQLFDTPFIYTLGGRFAVMLVQSAI